MRTVRMPDRTINIQPRVLMVEISSVAPIPISSAAFSSVGIASISKVRPAAMQVKFMSHLNVIPHRDTGVGDGSLSPLAAPAA